MQAGLRPYVTAGLVLVGSSVIAVTPLMARPDMPVVGNVAIRLAADSSVLNIPVNLAEDIINIPANETVAINNWATAVAAGGSWWSKTPTNVWGWDPGNPPMIEAFVDMVVPIPSISGNGGLPATNPDGSSVNPPGDPVDPSVLLGGSALPGTLGYQLNEIIAAELPMNSSCGFTCASVIGEVTGWFRVPLSDLMDPNGYTFPTVTDANGVDYPVGWSGQTAPPLDPTEPFTNYIDHLMAPPEGIQTPSLQELIDTGQHVTDANNIAFNGWFPHSYLFDGLPELYGVPILVDGIINDVVGSPILPTTEAGTTISLLNPIKDFFNSIAAQTTTVPDASTFASPLAKATPATTPSPTFSADVASDTATTDPGPAKAFSLTARPQHSAAEDNPLSQALSPTGGIGKHRAPEGGLAGAANSVTKRIGAATSKATDSLKSTGVKSGGLKASGLKSGGGHVTVHAGKGKK